MGLNVFCSQTQLRTLGDKPTTISAICHHGSVLSDFKIPVLLLQLKRKASQMGDSLITLCSQRKEQRGGQGCVSSQEHLYLPPQSDTAWTNRYLKVTSLGKYLEAGIRKKKPLALGKNCKIQLNVSFDQIYKKRDCVFYTVFSWSLSTTQTRDKLREAVKSQRKFINLFVTANIHPTKTSQHILRIKHVVSAFKKKAFYV